MNDEMIKKAVMETLCPEYIASIPPHEEAHVFSEGFCRKMDKLIKRREKPYYPLIKTAGRRLAAAAAAVVIVLSASVFIWLDRAGVPHTKVNEGEGSLSSETDQACGEQFIVSEFASEEELREYIAREKDDLPPELFAEDPADGKARVMLYSPAGVPPGYELSSVVLNGNFLTYHYINSEEGAEITFAWGYKTDGDEYLKNAAEIFGLEPMPGYEGYYFSGAVDDTGTEIYQIYWSEDGFCFQLNVPAGHIPAPEETAAEPYDLSVAKKYYDAE